MISWREQLSRAILDYRYLMDRGYNSKPSLDLISGRYELSREERLLLYRCVHSESQAREVREKMGLDGTLIIDGFNVGLTLLSVWDGDQVFLCDDLFLRDLASGKKKQDSRIVHALITVAELLLSLGLEFLIVLDSQVSGSGEIAAKLRKMGINAKVASKADKEIIEMREVSVTSDFVVLTRSKKVYDVCTLLVDRSQVINIRDFIG
ncbi:MAG: DUF434 domain-containing protein [Metallosphaera sp.]